MQLWQSYLQLIFQKPNMKNLIKKIIIFSTSTFIGLSSLSFALAADATTTQTDEVFHKFQYTNNGNATSKIGLVKALPEATWQQTITAVIKLLLNVTGAIALLALTAGGVMMVTAAGNTDQIDKAKKIITYSIVGLVIIAVSYAIVLGVSQLQFFTPGTANNSTASPTTPVPATPQTGNIGNNSGV